MSQDRVEYWWKYIQNTEAFYNMSITNANQDIDSFLYEQFKRLMDYIYGYDTDEYISGITYGLKLIPYGQNIFVSQDVESDVDTSGINYNSKCVNLEYSSSPHGAPIVELGSGSLSINDNIYIPDNTDKPVKLLNPPGDLKDVILTSSIYFDTDTFLDKLNNNIKISQAISESIQIEHLKSGSQYILRHGSKKFSFDDDFSIYIRNILNNEYFPQINGQNIFNIAKIVWRISDSTQVNINDYIYEYFLIDYREIYGFYGLKQIEAFSLINILYNGINFSNDNLIVILKQIFSYLFNDMSGVVGSEFTPNFITYWTNQGKTISSVLQDLYDELYDGD